jgi:hypothetical protein
MALQHACAVGDLFMLQVKVTVRLIKVTPNSPFHNKNLQYS